MMINKDEIKLADKLEKQYIQDIKNIKTTEELEKLLCIIETEFEQHILYNENVQNLLMQSYFHTVKGDGILNTKTFKRLYYDLTGSWNYKWDEAQLLTF